MKGKFNPNNLSFEEGLKRIEEAAKYVGLEQDKQIVTSRDRVSIKLRERLNVDNVPKGFKKWQLPVSLPKASQLFITVGEPNVKVDRHSHDEGAGIRFIVSGSIIYGGQELSGGDWMYIPAGEDYECYFPIYHRTSRWFSAKLKS